MPKCTGYVSNMHMHIHTMHIQAYAYSYHAYPGISIHECLDMHTGAIPTWICMSIGYCMSVLCWIYIRTNIWKKPNSEYDYMHVRGSYPGSYLEFLIYLGNIGIKIGHTDVVSVPKCNNNKSDFNLVSKCEDKIQFNWKSVNLIY